MERLTQSIAGWTARMRTLDGRDAIVAAIVLLVPGASVPWLLFVAWQRFRQSPTEATAVR